MTVMLRLVVVARLQWEILNKLLASLALSNYLVVFSIGYDREISCNRASMRV